MKLYSKLNLGQKLLFLGLLPAVILSIALLVYFTNTLISDAEIALQKKGRELSVSISKACVYGVFSGNTKQLNNLLTSFADDADILLIEITDINSHVLAKINKSALYPKETKVSFAQFSQPIFIERAHQADDLDLLLLNINQTPTNNIIGHIRLHLSFHPTKKHQQTIFYNSIYLTLLALTLIFSIAKITSKTIAKPILNLVNDVKGIREGHFTLHSKINSGNDEISSLTKNIHKMAHEIENHQFQMELKVQEATTNLEKKNTILLSAQKSLIQTTKSKSNFISHMSHEIRTPLNGIIGFLDLLQQTSLSSQQRHLLQSALSSSSNLKFITNEVLDTAQLEAGKVIIHKVDFNLRETVENTISLLSTIANEKNVTLEFNIDTSISNTIHQDPIKIGQILINLLSNAIKFSPNTHVILVISTDLKHEHLVIKIIDKGRGIAPDNLPSLFDEFTQFENLDYAHGSGLGLAITKKIVHSMQGLIRVHSTLNKGSTFTVELPYEKAINSGIKKKSALSNPPNLSGKRILIADDNEINREVLFLLLKQQQATIDSAIDGKEALALSLHKKYELILLDINMPFKKGDQVLAEIRSNQNNLNNKTPIAAITAHITSDTESASHKVNFDGYLVKPISKETLFELINKLLRLNQIFESNKNIDNNLAPKIFNKNKALDRINNDSLFLISMLSKFFSELEAQLNDIKSALEQRSFNKVFDIVHKVHGAASYCGMEQLTSSAKALENSLALIDSNNQPPNTHEVDKTLVKNFITQVALSLEKQHDFISDLKTAVANDKNEA